MALFPVDVFAQHIAPYLFDSLAEAFGIICLCKKTAAASEKAFFWVPLLEKQRRAMVASTVEKRRPLWELLYSKGSSADFLKWTPKQHVQARMVQAPRGYRQRKGTHYCWAWEEGELIEGAWKDGTCDTYVAYLFCARVEMCERSRLAPCRIQWQSGLRYEGTAVFHKPSGHGRYTLADGTTIEGEWNNGDCDCATVTFADGRPSITCGVDRGRTVAFMELEESFLVLPSEGLCVTQADGVLQIDRDDMAED